MEVKNDTSMDRSDEILMPGFRFHPTDEELVSFYLKRKIQQRPISIELIRQLDIYKYDPWDLPKLASTGEKEWYFYCPRDRKYRNSVRPNRVTAAGFWKATGTDRPIYSSEGTKCIGLKKSLVFYKGRAARGMKTDWMMHEFRLPSPTDPSLPKRPIDNNIPLNDSWTICRIFKKTSSSVAQRGMHAWGVPFPGAAEAEMFSAFQAAAQAPEFALESSSCSQQVAPPAAAPSSRFTSRHGLQRHHQQSNPAVEGSSCKLINFNCGASPLQEPQGCPIVFPFEIPTSQKPASSSALVFGAQPDHHQQQLNGFVVDSSADVNGNTGSRGQDSYARKPGNGFSMNGGDGEAAGRINFPFDLGVDFSEEWRCNIPWDSFLSPAAAVQTELPLPH